MLIIISSVPAKSLAIDYAVTEVSSNCNKKEVILASTDYLFTFKASGKEKEEESEEAMRNSTLAEESEERPEGKRCKIDVSPTVATSGAVLCNLLPKSLPKNIFNILKVQCGSDHSISIPRRRTKREKNKSRRKIPIHLLVAKTQYKMTCPSPRLC